MALQIQTEVRKTRRVLLYGPTKSGKTTCALKFPKPVIAQDVEMSGATFAGAPFVTIDTCASFAKFVSDVAGDKSFQSVVLDDFSNAIRRWTTAAAAIEKDPRAGYRKVYASVMPLIQQLIAQPRHLIITGHYIKETELPATGYERAWVHPNFPDALEIYIMGMFDIIGYCYNNSHMSALVFESADQKRRIVAGSRVGLPFTQYAAKSNGIVSLETLAQEAVK